MRFNPPSRRAGLTVAAAGLLALSAAPAANAAPTSARAKTDALATSLSHQLGSRSAGSYLDSSKKLVVTVTNAADAKTVKAAGATPRTVARSGAQLATAKAVVDAAAVPGTARAVDPITDTVVVTLDSTVTGAKLAKVQKAINSLGSAVKVRHVSGHFRTLISGGDAIYGSGYRCSLGFNVTTSSGPGFITAGHCGNVVSTWYSDSGESSALATTGASTFPGHDYSLATYSGSASHPSEVDLYNGSSQSISGAGNASVGESVQRSGSTSGLHGGTVTATDASVTYQEGTVNGLIDTDVCAEPGDSGGALFDGSSALGLTSGGSGDCSSGGETFFQPVPAALSALGASIG